MCVHLFNWPVSSSLLWADPVKITTSGGAETLIKSRSQKSLHFIVLNQLMFYPGEYKFANYGFGQVNISICIIWSGHCHESNYCKRTKKVGKNSFMSISFYINCPYCLTESRYRIERKWWMRLIPGTRYYQCRQCNCKYFVVPPRLHLNNSI
jgi:hypothetical protein